MARAFDRLEQEYADVSAATGSEFFRRLRDYATLLESDEKINAAVEAVMQEVVEAEAAFAAKDRQYVAELVELRNELVSRLPNLDDSEEEKPPRPDGPMDRAGYNRLDKWKWTLANFDAVAEEREDRIVEQRGLDVSRSRMLAEILRAKLYEPVNAGDATEELKDLNRRVNYVANRESTDHQRLERAAQDSGAFALKRVETIVSYLDVRDPSPLKTPEETRDVLEAGLIESMGGFHHLREAMRPKEARGSLSADAKQAVERHETDARLEVERLQRALRKRLDSGAGLSDRLWWDLSRNERIGVVGVGVAALVGIGAIIATITTAT